MFVPKMDFCAMGFKFQSDLIAEFAISSRLFMAHGALFSKLNPRQWSECVSPKEKIKEHNQESNSKSRFQIFSFDNIIVIQVM